MPLFQITLSTSHQLALTVDERVYSWGDNTHGQLGHGDRRVRTVPTLVDALQGKGVSRLAAGQKFQGKIRIFIENPEVFLRQALLPVLRRPRHCHGLRTSPICGWRPKRKRRRLDEAEDNRGIAEVRRNFRRSKTLNFFSREDIVEVSCGEQHAAVLTVSS